MGVADAIPGIAESAAGHRNEFPTIFSGRQRQLQDAIGSVVADFAVGFGVAERGVAAPSSADNDFTDAVLGIGVTFRVLWGESLIGMFVASKNQIGVNFVQVLLEGTKLRMLGMFGKESAAEQRVMSIGKSAGIGMRGEVVLQPGFFGRPLPAAAQFPRPAIGIENDDVPCAEVIAVIPFSRVSGLLAPVTEVAGGGGTVVLMIARGRARARLEASPGRSITFLKFFVSAVLISQIACGEDRTGNLVDELRGGFCARKISTARNVASPHQDESGLSFLAFARCGSPRPRNDLRGSRLCRCRVDSKRQYRHTEEDLPQELPRPQPKP